MITRNGCTFAALSATCFILGAWLGYGELIAVAVAFLLCLVLAGAWMGRRPPIDVTRDVVPSRVAEGEGAAGVLTITNRGHRRCPPIIAVESFGGGSVSVSIGGLAAGATHTEAYRLPTHRRGCYAVGPLVIGKADPLRLASSAKDYGSPATLWVHPRTHRVAPIPTGRSQDLDGPTSVGAPSGGIAFHSLREYQPGDDPRLIHWRSTARTGTLMVRHTVVTNEPRLLIVLDTCASSYAGDAFENAVRIAASLVVAGAESGFPTQFRTTGGLRGSIDPTGLGRTDVLDTLASVHVNDDPGLATLVQLAARREQGVSLGVVTSQPADEVASIVGQVRRRFEMVTVVQVMVRLDRPPIRVSGVLGVTASDSADFARVWNARIR